MTELLEDVRKRQAHARKKTVAKKKAAKGKKTAVKFLQKGNETIKVNEDDMVDVLLKMLPDVKLVKQNETNKTVNNTGIQKSVETNKISNNTGKQNNGRKVVVRHRKVVPPKEEPPIDNEGQKDGIQIDIADGDQKQEMGIDDANGDGPGALPGDTANSNMD